MKNFFRGINGLYNNIYFTDTDSLYIEKKYCDVLDEVKLVAEELYLGKNDYKSGGIFYSLVLALKKMLFNYR